MIAETLPPPDAAELAVSERLVERIKHELDAHSGWISFERFMQMALFEPELGYYSGTAAKFGSGGDFTTAPELSDWFATALALQIARVFEQLDTRCLLELGAGTGQLAGQLLQQLEGLGYGEIDYSILEPSADLRARQIEHLATQSAQVRWLDSLPTTPMSGVVLANEVADCLPVARFFKSGGAVLPLGVGSSGSQLTIEPGPADPRLTAAVDKIESVIGDRLPDGYRSEVCLILEPWLSSVLDSIASGGMLLIDYGMPRRDYYRTDRSDGTLICHYRQRAHNDPLLWPGLQDLTAWVDFSAVAAAAVNRGFRVAGYTTQAQFLLESLASNEVLSARPMTPAAASAFKTLVLPGEMGERFKLIWLTTLELATPLPGRDFRTWL